VRDYRADNWEPAGERHVGNSQRRAYDERKPQALDYGPAAAMAARMRSSSSSPGMTQKIWFGNQRARRPIASNPESNGRGCRTTLSEIPKSPAHSRSKRWG